MDHHSPFVSLLLITLLAVVVPIVVSRIRFVRLPVVVGEIVAGMVIGQSGLNLVQETPTLTFLMEFGFVFLMFLSGLEISLDTLAQASTNDGTTSRWRRPIPLALISFGLTVALAVGIGFGLTAFDLARSPLLMGLILSTTSLGIVVPVLKERALTNSQYGQTVLITALTSDFVTLLLLSFVIALIRGGWSLDLLLFMLLLAAFLAAARIGPWVRQVPGLQRILDELSHATAQIRVRGALALMVTWVVLAESLGVEVILGAFLAGAVISISGRHKSELPEKLDAIGYGFFIPLFFIMVGATFDLRSLLASPAALLLVPVLIVAAYLVKLLPILLFRTMFSWRETLAAGFLLSSRLSLIIAASAIALDLGIISDAVNSAVVLVAIVTCTFSPIAFGRLLPQKQETSRAGVIILGTDQMAQLVGERLRRSGEAVTFIGRDQQRLEALRGADFAIVPGDLSDDRVLRDAGAERARALIAVSNAADVVRDGCRRAIEQYAIPTVIARANDPALLQELSTMGVRVVQPAMATAVALEGALLFPAAFNLLLDKSDEVDLLDVPLHNPALVNRPLRKVRLPGNALVLGVRRGGEVVVPHGDTVLQRDDMLMLVGSPAALREAQATLATPHPIKVQQADPAPHAASQPAQPGISEG